MAIVGDSATAALQTVLEERLDELADEAAGRIMSEIPAYRSADAQMRRDVRAHVRAHLTASIGSLGEASVTREDLLFVRPHAARRAKRVSLSDFVRAFYIGEAVPWGHRLSLGAHA